jgi:ATP-dependent exoDNAse (exonuclease V) beta subunit
VDVTEDIDARTRHGEDWAVLGSLFHRLFEEISKGGISYKDLAGRLKTLLKNEPSLKGDAGRYEKIVLRDFLKLEESGHLKEIIMPVPSTSPFPSLSGEVKRAYAELPFILQRGDRVYKGRIDRVIIRDNIAYIYDYKTFPVSEREIEELSEKYRFQMEIYSAACRELFSMKTRSFILFTHRPYLVEVT